MNVFRPGNRVRCIDAFESGERLRLGAVYVVADFEPGPGIPKVVIEDDHGRRGRWFANRFTLLGAETMAVCAEIVAERERQASKGFDAAHDDTHADGEIAIAAAAYIDVTMMRPLGLPIQAADCGWPWDARSFKPEGDRANLVKAAALLVAEIERMDRETARSGAEARVMAKLPEAVEHAMEEGP